MHPSTPREPIAVDPLTHTFVGGSLAATGLRRVTPLATATLILGANAPDVDILAQAFGPYTGLAWRRGLTHGVPALFVLPILLTGTVLWWDRRVRLRRDPDATPARPGPLLGLATIGVWTHPALDWLNTYGMRWWLPFRGDWSYGDAVFIVDPWLWLILGGATFLTFSTGWAARAGWAVLAVLLSLLVLGTGIAPPTARFIWIAGIAGLIALKVRDLRRGNAGRRERVARVAVAVGSVYILAMVAQTVVAERVAVAEAGAQGVTAVEAAMVGPVPADPFRGQVILRTPDGYRRGSFDWVHQPRLRLDPAVVANVGADSVIRRAMEHPDATNFLVWSRFPLMTVEDGPEGWTVRFRDVRYMTDGALGGPTIHVPFDPPAGTPEAP